MEDIQIGAHGHCAVPRVTMELKIVFAHAQIHRLQTGESNAQGLIKKHGYVETLIRAHFQVKAFSDKLTEPIYQICFHVRHWFIFFFNG